MDGLKEGVKNLDKHIENLQSFGQTVVVAFNRYANDTDEELDFVRQHCEEMGVGFAINNAFMEGGDGAIELANLVVNTIENNPSQPLTFTYDETDSVEEKVTKIACELYGAKQVLFGPAARKKIQMIKDLGYTNFPVCIAKTQYSFSTDRNSMGCFRLQFCRARYRNQCGCRNAGSSGWRNDAYAGIAERTAGIAH